MMHPNQWTARRYSVWLALASSLLFVGISLTATVVGQGLGPLSARPESSLLAVISDAYQGPRLCQECHPDEFAAWSHTTHASAAASPNFRRLLQEGAQSGECFACHTTGYDAANGQFLLAGVTCESCHGPFRPGHPEAGMIVAESAQLCGDCHTETLAAWQTSQHGQADVTCIACHEVHTQRTRAAVVTNALCLNCHGEHLQDFIHAEHEVESVHCVDCHLRREVDFDATKAVEGQAMMDHTFTASSANCRNCHQGVVE